MSALEHGRKGKPSERVLQGIIGYFKLSPAQIEELSRVVQASSPLLKLPSDSIPKIYSVGHLYTERAKYLSEQELSFIEVLLLGKKECESKTM